MKLEWKIGEEDVRMVRDFVQKRRRTTFVQERFESNVRGNRSPITRTRVWHGIILCLLTTQQRSGPGSNVSRFLNLRPFPVSYRKCREANRPAIFIRKALRKNGGIRRSETIAVEASHNLDVLTSGVGRELMSHLRTLEARPGKKRERGVADFLADHLAGLGPKQSRNLLQFLGLTRYEIPIDSRITKWLNDFGFPVHLSAASLADRDYYEFVSDGVQALCKRARVLPCIFDAAVFSSFDRDE